MTDEKTYYCSWTSCSVHRSSCVLGSDGRETNNSTSSTSYENVMLEKEAAIVSCLSSVTSGFCCQLIEFDVGRTLPNTDLSRDFMGLVVDGSMDLGTHIWHPPQMFSQGRMTSQRERVWDRDWPGTSNALSNLRLLLVLHYFNEY